MKEKIYTIPVNEAYEKACGCPLCHLEEQLEKDAVDYALGAAMMEPDYRLESNKKGYCRTHFQQLFDSPNKLSLALTLDTHLEELRKTLSAYEKEALQPGTEKKGFLKKKPQFAEKLCGALETVAHSCVICEKIEYTMQRYIDVLFYLWQHDDAFKKKFKASAGLCLPHMRQVCACAEKHLNQQKAAEFLAALFSLQQQQLDKLQEDIHRFTLKFDYRNKDMEWGDAKDAPIRTIETIAGYLRRKEESSPPV